MTKRFQIFVSSTFSDLQEERRQALFAILGLDCIPVGMEVFPAADEDPLKHIRRLIDDSDYYVLILGSRYGSLFTRSGLSFTEEEFRYAVQRRIPILSFFQEKQSICAEGQREEKPEMQLKLDAFRELVRSQDKLFQKFSSPADLAAKIVQSLHFEFERRPGIGWIRGVRPAAGELQLLPEHLQRIENLQEDGTSFTFHLGFPGELQVQVLKSDYARDPATRQKFIREQNALKGIDGCSHLLRTHEVAQGAEGELLYVVTEFREGRTLRSFLNDCGGQLRPEQAIGFALQMCDALEHAHQRDVYHRDLRPDNVVLVDHDRRVVPINFGMTMFLPVTDARYSAATLKSWQYAAPEELTRRAGTVSGDIYSLGIILLEMLGGGKAIHRRLPAQQILENVSADIAFVIDNCTDANPGERYPSIQKVRVALEEAKARMEVKPEGALWFLQARFAPLVLLAVGAWRVFMTNENRIFATAYYVEVLPCLSVFAALGLYGHLYYVWILSKVNLSGEPRFVLLRIAPLIYYAAGVWAILRPREWMLAAAFGLGVVALCNVLLADYARRTLDQHERYREQLQELGDRLSRWGIGAMIFVVLWVVAGVGGMFLRGHGSAMASFLYEVVAAGVTVSFAVLSLFADMNRSIASRLVRQFRVVEKLREGGEGG